MDYENFFQPIIEAARAEASPEIIDLCETSSSLVDDTSISSIPVLVFRDSNGTQRHQSLLEEVQRWRGAFATRPQRRQGTTEVHDLSSFVSLTNRNKLENSVIFADTDRRCVHAILDYHAPADGPPEFGQDRISYAFKFSPQFSKWCRLSGVALSQREFAKLIDDNIQDICEGPFGETAARYAKQRGATFATIPDMLVFTRSIAAKSTTESEDLIDEYTGDVAIQFKKKGDVKTNDGKPISVPQVFAIEVPILGGEMPNGAPATSFTIAARLRYDINDSKIAWKVEFHNPELYIRKAIEEAVAMIRNDVDKGGCGLPVYMGSA